MPLVFHSQNYFKISTFQKFKKISEAIIYLKKTQENVRKSQLKLRTNGHGKEPIRNSVDEKYSPGSRNIW